MSCRVALLRMQDDGLLTLPAPRHEQSKRRPKIPMTSATAPQPTVTTPVHELPALSLEIVTGRKKSALWREYIQRYHYLGYTPLPGAQLRYLAVSNGAILALLGFGAAAWKNGSTRPVHWLEETTTTRASAPDCQQCALSDSPLGEIEELGLQTTGDG